MNGLLLPWPPNTASASPTLPWTDLAVGLVLIGLRLALHDGAVAQAACVGLLLGGVAGGLRVADKGVVGLRHAWGVFSLAEWLGVWGAGERSPRVPVVPGSSIHSIQQPPPPSREELIEGLAGRHDRRLAVIDRGDVDGAGRGAALGGAPRGRDLLQEGELLAAHRGWWGRGTRCGCGCGGGEC